MSGRRTTKKTTAKAQTGEQSVKQKAEKKYSVEKLGEHCKKLFGVSSCAYAGATAGMTGEYTVAEMKAYIEKWRRTEVK